MWLENHKPTSRMWQRVWQKAQRFAPYSIRTTVHSCPVVLNYGHTYPIHSRKFPTLNNPLIELVNQAYRATGRAITFLDIGANVGDSILLLNTNCPEMIKEFCCVEGDAEFFSYLQFNLSSFDNAVLVSTLLSGTNGKQKELLRTHAGTSSAQGNGSIPSKTLDTILAESSLKEFDVVKIDVEGMDGLVMEGAKLLLEQRPAVIFEWHPILCEKTGNCWTHHFETLCASGYTRFIWFTKFGTFSHFMAGYDQATINTLAQFCLQTNNFFDWHYDVVALHADSPISDVALADLLFAQARKSNY